MQINIRIGTLIMFYITCLIRIAPRNNVLGLRFFVSFFFLLFTT